MNNSGQKKELIVLLLVALAARLPAFFFAGGGGGALSLAFKFPALAGDLGLVWILHLILLRLNPPVPGAAPERGVFLNQRAFWPALAWAANPLAVLISAGLGNFDSLALFFVMLAVYYFEFSSHPLSDRYAALSLGAAVGLKLWPVFLALVFVKNLLRARERLLFCLWMLVPLGLCLPFLAWKPGGLLEAVLGYHGTGALSLPEALKSLYYAAGATPEAYGRLAWAYERAAGCALALSALAYGLGRWQFPLLPGLSLAVLSLYVFAPALSPSCLLWLVPFSLVLRRSLALRHLWLSLALGLVFCLEFAPEALFNSSFKAGGQVRTPFLLFWAAFNLGAWLFWLKEWRFLLKWCLRPPGWIHTNR